jgi:putative membrane protein
MLRARVASVHHVSNGGRAADAMGATCTPRAERIARVNPKLSWALEPVPIIAAVALGGLYVTRWRAVRASPHRDRDAPVWRLCCFGGALVLALAALISPLDSLADELFFMHMIQHVVLLDLVPILAIVGLTRVLLRPATRAIGELERRAGVIAHPVFAVVLYVAVIWGWHIPAAYDDALHHNAVDLLEHTTFLLAGSLYWWHLLSPIRARMRLGGLGPVVYMGSTKLLVGALGMGLAFAPSALYAYYEHRARVWGISAVSDQSLAGILMAVEQSIVMGIALVVLFVRALAESEREQQRRERFEGA